MRMRTVLKRLARMTVLAIAACAALAHADAKVDQEHEVKAAFIANFIKFIDWPDLGAPGSKFVVGVYGADDYDQTIDNALANKTIDGHPIVVMQLHSDAEIKNCRMVVSGATSEDRINHLEQLCGTSGTVLVGEGDEFAKDGGTISLLVINSQIRFDVNLDSAKKIGVNISSKLLYLAHDVIREGG